MWEVQAFLSNHNATRRVATVEGKRFGHAGCRDASDAGEASSNNQSWHRRDKRHCEEGCRDITGLSRARLNLTSASRRRSQFISDTVSPCLLEGADEQSRLNLADFLVAFRARRLVSDEHIAIWSDDHIRSDPQGYCVAAKAIWAMMEDQMDREARILGGQLRRHMETFAPVR